MCYADVPLNFCYRTVLTRQAQTSNTKRTSQDRAHLSFRQQQCMLHCCFNNQPLAQPQGLWPAASHKIASQQRCQAWQLMLRGHPPTVPCWLPAAAATRPWSSLPWTQHTVCRAAYQIEPPMREAHQHDRSFVGNAILSSLCLHNPQVQLGSALLGDYYHHNDTEAPCAAAVINVESPSP